MNSNIDTPNFNHPVEDHPQRAERRLGLQAHCCVEEGQSTIKGNQSRIPLGSSEAARALIGKFIHSIGSPGAALKYRAAIQHFLSWCDKSGVDIYSTTLVTVEEFGVHKCGMSCNAIYRSKSLSNLPVISRFLSFMKRRSGFVNYGWPNSLHPTLQTFNRKLLDEGVSPKRAQATAQLASHLILWTALQGIIRSSIDVDVVEQFAAHSCFCGVKCRRKAPTSDVRNERSLAATRFLRFLSGQSLIFEDGRLISTRKRLVLSPVLLRYRTWLIQQRGLRTTTIQSYVLELARWLPRIGEDASTSSATSIRDLASSELSRRAPVTQGKFITSVRSYLQFCASEGRGNPALAQVIISRRSYSLSSIPRRIKVAEIQRVLESVDLSRSGGLRDRAVLLLLAELGLRAAEVAKISLTDLDWEHATIRIDGKGGSGCDCTADPTCRQRHTGVHCSGTP